MATASNETKLQTVRGLLSVVIERLSDMDYYRSSYAENQPHLQQCISDLERAYSKIEQVLGSEDPLEESPATDPQMELDFDDPNYLDLEREEAWPDEQE